MRAVATAILLTIATAGHAQADAWRLNSSCGASSPASPDQVQLSVVTYAASDENGKSGEQLHVRMRAPEKLFDTSMSFEGGKLEVPGTIERTDLKVQGAPNGDGYLFTVVFAEVDGKILDAISTGAEIQMTVPTPGGEKVLTRALEGSGVAIRKIRQCRK